MINKILYHIDVMCMGCELVICSSVLFFFNLKKSNKNRCDKNKKKVLYLYNDDASSVSKLRIICLTLLFTLLFLFTGYYNIYVHVSCGSSKGFHI